jgi:hypothetical protein
MALSKKQEQAIVNWIDKFPKCPNCGSDKRSYYKNLVGLAMDDPSGAVRLGIQDVRCFCVTCEACGFYRLVGCREAGVPIHFVNG